MQRKIMILSASAGSGHVKAAAAIEEACRKDSRVSDVLNIDSLEYTYQAFQRIYSKGYLEAVKTAPDLWAMAFEATDKPWRTSQMVQAMQKISAQPLAKKILEWKPDICICTHPLPAEIIANLIMQDKIKTNVGIVVTDFYVHAFWLVDLFTRYFVPKGECRAHLGLLGIPTDRIVVSGVPVMESFSAPTPKRALLAKYGLKDTMPIVLLSAGTFGTMRAPEILKILEEIRTPCQIIVICGKNANLKEELESTVERRAESIRNAYSITGYTDKMDEYLKMADVYIGKPGGLSTSECLASGVPMVIWNPIPGQEEYNAHHVIEHGAGVLPNNALTIGFKVDEILSNPEKRRRMSENALAISFPHAAKTIVDAMLADESELPVKALKKYFRK